MRNVTRVKTALAVLTVSGSLVAAGIAGSPSARAAASCPTLDSNGVPVSGVGPNVDWEGCNLPGVNLYGANLYGANLKDANLYDANLAEGSLANADVAGANLSAATLNDEVLQGTDLTGADLAGARLPYAQGNPILAGANLTGAMLLGAWLDGADLHGANLTDAAGNSLRTHNANLRGAILTGADLTSADLTQADLTGATGLDTATTAGVTWTHAICPNGTSADSYTGGCAGTVTVTTPTATPAVSTGTVGSNGWYTSAVTVSWNWLDANALTANCPASTGSTGQGAAVQITAACTDAAGQTGTASLTEPIDWAPPTQTVTAVTNGRVYTNPRVLIPGCADTDAVSGVARQSAMDLYGPTVPGTNLGVLDGVYQADCRGAVDNAGNQAGATPQVKWTMTYLLGGFTSPKAGAVVSRTATRIIVRTFFAQMPTVEQAARAAAHEVKATLSGPGLTHPVAAVCTWNSTLLKLQCAIPVPRGVKTGRKYVITVYENLGGGWLKVPPAATRENPEPVYFK